jgi:mercuric ion transport protein
MNDRMLLRTGIVGSVVAAVCCSTPVPALVLGALGLSAWLAWVDHVVFAALIAFLAIAAYALFRMHSRKGAPR